MKFFKFWENNRPLSLHVGPPLTMIILLLGKNWGRSIHKREREVDEYWRIPVTCHVVDIVSKREFCKIVDTPPQFKWARGKSF